MGAKEQAKPLAPANSHHLRSDEEAYAAEHDVVSHHIKFQQRKYVQCCGLAAALFLIMAVTAIVLGFTVFHIKGPRIEMNSVTLLSNRTSFSTKTNVTLLADVSVKNPNAASFKYENATTSVYYNGTEVGQGRSPGGVARARRTMRMNVTVEIVTATLLRLPGVMEEVSSGNLTVSSFTRIRGKVKVLMVKKNVVVELNCTLTYNLGSGQVQGDKCHPRVIL